MRRCHRRAQLAMRGEYTVVSRQVHPRRRHQRRQPCHEIQRLDHDVRGAVPVRGLERVAHMARRSQAQAFGGHRRAAHVATQPFKLRPLVGRNVDAGVQREPAGAGRSVRAAFQALQPGWHRLQREQLLPGSGANGNPVGDRRAQQIIQWAAFAIPGEPGVLARAVLHEAP
jgi:hypothetical protein